jgi:hypothetical protein
MFTILLGPENWRSQPHGTRGLNTQEWKVPPYRHRTRDINIQSDWVRRFRLDVSLWIEWHVEWPNLSFHLDKSENSLKSYEHWMRKDTLHLGEFPDVPRLDQICAFSRVKPEAKLLQQHLIPMIFWKSRTARLANPFFSSKLIVVQLFDGNI